jgi:hypothetical protein
MPPLTNDQQNDLGLTPPPLGEEEVSKVSIEKISDDEEHIYRQRITLNEVDAARVRELMFKAVTEWENNTTLLHNRLRRYNNQMEGIKTPKDFPWKNSSNLHIPITEIHINGTHSILVETVINNDFIWKCRVTLPEDPQAPEVNRDIEEFVDYKSRGELAIDQKLDEYLYNACRDPLALWAMDWVEEYETRFDVAIFQDVDSFQQRFPDPKTAGVTPERYQKLISKILEKPPLRIKVKEYCVKFRGPYARIVELKDFVIVPVTSPSIRYALFYGDVFTERDNYFRVRANMDWYDKTEVETMLAKPGSQNARDLVSQQQDRIEGLGRARSTPVDERHCVQGNLSIDLNNDGEEELYAVVFHKDTKSILRFEEYPYWHNRPNYIPAGLRKRSNRLLRRCINDMLFDINEEIDTQHNQRIDARTITLVPSFLKKSTSLVKLDRSDQFFYPGVCFTVQSMDELKQMPISQTDMGQSLQEESNLMQIAELETGWISARGGQSNPKDPRASGKKTQALIGQSNQRIDAYLKSLKPSIDEIGSQILELYYQFSPDHVSYPTFSPETKQWIEKDIQRRMLRSRARSIALSHASVLDNPDITAQRALVKYQVWSKNQLINQKELTKRTMLDMREKDIETLMLSDQQSMQQSQQQGIHEQLKGGPDGEGGEATGRKQGGPDLNPQTLTRKKGTADKA